MTQPTDDIKLPELPIPCTRIEPVRSGLMEYTGADMDDHALAAVLADRERQLQRLPADWHMDSSLETWFPLTAEQLQRDAQDAALWRTLRDVPDDRLGEPGIPCVAMPSGPRSGEYLNGADAEMAVLAAMAREAK